MGSLPFVSSTALVELETLKRMAGYVIVEIDVTDPVEYEEYKKQAAAAVAQHGGKYIVRGGAIEMLEGDWKPKRIVVLEFPSTQRAKEWLNLRGVPRAAQNSPAHGENQHDPGGWFVIRHRIDNHFVTLRHSFVSLSYCTLYPSASGTPVETFILPGGHLYPPPVAALIVKFFRENPRRS